jgi:hypothetical protein
MTEKSSSSGGEKADWTITMLSVPMAAIELWRPVMSAAVEWNRKVSEIAFGLNKEWLDFLNRRFAEDIALQEHLGPCKSFEEVWGVYADFSKKAVDDYQKEYAEIVKLGTGAASEPAIAIQKRVMEAAEEMRAPSKAA